MAHIRARSRGNEARNKTASMSVVTMHLHLLAGLTHRLVGLLRVQRTDMHVAIAQGGGWAAVGIVYQHIVSAVR